MSSYSAQVFKWSEMEMTLKDLIANYKRLFPFPILITNGFSEESNLIQTPAASTVFWVHDLVKSTHIVVEDREGRRFMIPEILDKMVVPIQSNGKKGQAFPFREIRCRKGIRYISFVEPMQEVRIENSNGEKEFYPLTDLRVVDVCDEDMLVVHFVFMENVFVPSKTEAKERTHHKVLPPQFTLLPSYLPIRVSIALSLAEAPDVIYLHTMAEMKEIVERYPHDYDAAKKEAAEILLCASDAPIYVNLVGQERPGLGEAAISVPRSGGVDPVTRLHQLHEFYENQDSFDVDSDQPECKGQSECGVWPQNASNDKQQKKRRENDKKTHSFLKKAVQIVQNKQSKKGNLNGRQNRNSAPELFTKGTRLPERKRLSVDSAVGRENKQESCFGEPRPIRNLADVPEDISGLSIEDISDCLELLNLAKHVPAMRQKKVDGRLLLCLGEEELKSVFGFSDFSATKLIQFSKCGWRPKVQQSQKHLSISKGLESLDVRPGQHYI